MQFDPITEDEKERLGRLAVTWGATLDFDEVAEHAKRILRECDTLLIRNSMDKGPNERAAISLLYTRIGVKGLNYESEIDGLTHLYIDSLQESISLGRKLLENNGVYWRYTPTIEIILDLTTGQAEEAYTLVREFEESDYGVSLYQHAEKFHYDARYWASSEATPEYIELGLEAYRNALGIFERGFPLVLGLKRILDGTTPALGELQNLRISRIRDELLDTDTHENSVYFDLILKSYNPRVRNAISHGDLIHDPTERAVKIPNCGRTYSYSDFIDILSQNIAIGIFLSGMFQSLITWHHLSNVIDGVSMDQLAL